jgi:ribosomal protein S27AE
LKRQCIPKVNIICPHCGTELILDVIVGKNDFDATAKVMLYNLKGNKYKQADECNKCGLALSIALSIAGDNNGTV